MKLRITWIVALMVLGFSNFSSAATTYTYNGHQYALTTEGKNWLDAEAEAVAWGGHLVTINNQAEQDWLASQFPFTDERYQRIMIGFNDIAVEGNWVWVSGEAVTYTNWCSEFGEPNNGGYPGLNEDVAIMNWGNDPTIPYKSWWNDVPGGGIGIMERVAPVPLPSAVLLLGSGLVGLLGIGRKIRNRQ